MKLILEAPYPYPLPDDYDSDKWLYSHDAALTLELDNVVHFEWKHTITVEFDTYQHMREAQELTGWPKWGDPDYHILEAPTSVEDGYYGHSAILVKDRAYCGFILVP